MTKNVIAGTYAWDLGGTGTGVTYNSDERPDGPGPVVSLAVTGTLAGSTEAQMVTGGRTTILTLTNDTWVASGATFNAIRQAIINEQTASATPTNGFNNEVRDNEVVGSVARTSDTVVTITWSAAASYSIATPETITSSAPASALVTSIVLITGTPNALITAAETNLSGLFFHENFEAISLGVNPNTISGLQDFTAASEISSDEFLSGTRACKNVSLTAGTEGFPIGFVAPFSTNLVEGDESWFRIPIFIPVGSDLDAPGFKLKWMRGQTQTAAGENKGYNDIYYNDGPDAFDFIKEGVFDWSNLSTGTPNGMEFGKWIFWEYYIKYSATVGIIRYWKDGILVNELLNEQTLTDSTDEGTAQFFITYWNGGIPKQQTWFYDEITIALEGGGRTDSTQLVDDAAGNKYIGLAL